MLRDAFVVGGLVFALAVFAGALLNLAWVAIAVGSVSSFLLTAVIIGVYLAVTRQL